MYVLFNIVGYSYLYCVVKYLLFLSAYFLKALWKLLS